jgi:hypothetical protein
LFFWGDVFFALLWLGFGGLGTLGRVPFGLFGVCAWGCLCVDRCEGWQCAKQQCQADGSQVLIGLALGRLVAGWEHIHEHEFKRRALSPVLSWNSKKAEQFFKNNSLIGCDDPGRHIHGRDRFFHSP